MPSAFSWEVVGVVVRGSRSVFGVDRSRDGSVEVRFVPVPAARTEYFTAELIDRYQDAQDEGRHHPVLLVGLFVLDLSTIHPFTDGNGRVVRALTIALLDDSGYTIGRYVSLEQLIAESADNYHETLLASTHGWHEQKNDPWRSAGTAANALVVLRSCHQ